MEQIFVADADDAFKILREDLRASLRKAEAEFRRVLSEALPELSVYPEILGNIRASLCSDTAATFVRGLIGHYQILNALLNEADKLARSSTPGRARPNVN